MEKLVEEIRRERCKGCLFVRRLAEYKCGAVPERCREAIRRDIAHILKAVVDGILLPKEVGRCSRVNTPEFDDWVKHTIEFHHATLFIALRQGRRNDGDRR